MTRLLEVRDQVLKSLETARNEKLIGAPLEARVVLEADATWMPLLKQYESGLPALFITFEVELVDSTGGADLAVTIRKATGEKCDRCWKYTHDKGAEASLPGVCGACAGAVKEILAI